MPARKQSYNFADMPRRKQTVPLGLAILGVLVFLMIVVPVIGALASHGGLVFVGIVVVGTVALYVVSVIVVPRLRRNAMLEKVDAITDTHIDALIRQRTILVRNDAYGKPVYTKWLAEVGYFISSHVRPSLTEGLRVLLSKEETAVVYRIEKRVTEAAQQRPAFATIPTDITPTAFEAFCAETLRGCGWAVRLTSMSRDQGVDVVAEKNGMRVVLQCKLYGKPVGNKAVQEVATGRVHEQAHYGVVVTNNTYTSAAKELAGTNGIRLLHYIDLPNLESMLRA